MTLSVTIRHSVQDFTLDVAFEAPASGTTVLFGRSGAGKSTIIAAVAGLIRPAECRIAIDDSVMADTRRNVFVPPEHRRIGLVFQDDRLFPHMNVARNLCYGFRRAPSGVISFDDVVELLGIAPLLERRPHTLSGGEKSRVAIGRALLSQPKLLAMDEPLASLDGQHKAEILPYLMRLRRALDEFVVDGVETTLPLFRTLVRNADVQNGQYDIHWLEEFLKSEANADG